MHIKKIYLSYLILFFLTFAMAHALNADEVQDLPVYELEQITCTATRLERKKSEVAASVEIADEEKINDTRMLNIKEALVGMPGVLVETENQGYDSRIIIRGAGLKAKYGVRDIMVLFDGVPITDPDSLTRLDFVDTQLIKQVDVVKGPNSTLWGTNAAGGVINIIPKSPKEKQGGTAKITMGDYDTRSYHLDYSGNLKNSHFYSFSGTRKESNNSWRRWNKFDMNQGSIQTETDLDGETNWKNFFGYTDASTQLPGKLNQEMFDEYKKTGRAKETDGPWQYSGRYSEIFFFNSKLSKELGAFTFKPMVYGNIWSHRHPITGRINHADTNTFGTDFQTDYSHHPAGVDCTLSFGVTARYDDQDTDYFKYSEYTTTNNGRIAQVLSDKEGEKIEIQDRKVDLYGIYAQESFRPSDRWLIDAGIRFDEINFDITGTRTETYDYASGKYVPASDMDDIDQTYHDFSPRLGITYKVNDILNLYTNFSKGIQTPTESELTENPDLDLVSVKNYEIGSKAQHNRWSLDSAFYYSPVKNEVVQVIHPDGDSEYVNSGKTEKKGLEISGSFFIMPEWDAGATYSYTDYTFDDFSEPVRQGGTLLNFDRSGNSLPYIPENQYSFFTAYHHSSGFKFKLQTLSWGSYYIDNANSEKYEGYNFITNTMLGYETKRFDIALNIENIFNKYYAVEVQKDTQGKVTYNPAAPRDFFLQLTYYF